MFTKHVVDCGSDQCRRLCHCGVWGRVGGEGGRLEGPSRGVASGQPPP